MDVVAPLVILVLLFAVVYVVSAPLRRGQVEVVESRDQDRRDDLEAARDAKYREIRDAELDHETGKLSDADWRVLDRQLRGEAVDVLRQLDELQ
jgi:flagellar biosynthesis/type III secretory pathway M-ring protein FliF/YscJ